MRDIHSIGQAFKIVSGGTAKGEVDSEGSNLSEVSVRDTKPIASQEFPPQSKEKLREMFAQSISDDFEKGYKIVDTMINGYKQQAREGERKKAIKVLNYLIDTKGTMGGDFIDQTQYNLYNFRNEFKKRLREGKE